MKGGDLHGIWSPYALCQEVDYALQEGNGFTLAQSFDSGHCLGLRRHRHDPLQNGPLLGPYCGFCAVGHNSMRDLIILQIIPNSLWISTLAEVVSVGAVVCFWLAECGIE
ncbi:hypothetical protein BDN71DRAFT_1495093 [Pleurotus eryngii]|uniref:Uncharacterized protein n=1 Tax=Pleurotus eryngii TaxID=5323 RepID=A0A9P6DGK0_PLEER|nr:hypothetical protein BDN71DRAFT_1495093 [Pleurotus eryngii]